VSRIDAKQEYGLTDDDLVGATSKDHIFLINNQRVGGTVFRRSTLIRIQKWKLSERIRQEQEEEAWCVCRRPASIDSMIACDAGISTKCVEWYHSTCVGLSEAAMLEMDVDADWTCPSCIEATAASKLA
jgi:hypothetical protein